MPLDIPRTRARTLDELSGATVTSKLEKLIEKINVGSGENYTVLLPAESTFYDVEAELPPITGGGFTIKGEGPGTRLRIPSTATGVTKIFQFGDDSTEAQAGLISDLWIEFENTPAQDEAHVSFHNCEYIDFERVRFQNAARVFTFGGATTKAVRCNARMVWGDFRAGKDCDGHILIQNMSAVELRRIMMSDGEAAARTGALMKVQTVAGGLIDTLDMISVKLQSWGVKPGQGTPDGKPKGRVFDCSGGNIVNVWDYASVLDHTLTSAMEFVGSANEYRVIKVNDARLATDDGEGIVVEHGSDEDWSGLEFNNVQVPLEGAYSGARVEAETNTGRFEECSFTGFRVSETSTTSKPSGIQINARGGWTISDLMPKQRNDGQAIGLQYALGIGRSDIADITAYGIDGTHCAVGGINHPAYAAVSAHRIFEGVSGPNGPEVQPVPQFDTTTGTLDLGTTSARIVEFTGAGTVTSLGTSAPQNVWYLIRFTGASTMQDGAALSIQGGANMVMAADQLGIAHRISTGWAFMAIPNDALNQTSADARYGQLDAGNTWTRSNAYQRTGAHNQVLRRTEDTTDPHDHVIFHRGNGSGNTMKIQTIGDASNGCDAIVFTDSTGQTILRLNHNRVVLDDGNDPTAPAQLTNKQFVDARINTGSTGWTSYATEAASIAFTISAGGSNPSTVSSAQYRWRRCQVTGDVEFEIAVKYSSAGSNVTSAELPFPAALPTPSYPHGTPASNETFGIAAGFLVAGATVPGAAERAWLKYDGTNPIVRVQGSANADHLFARGSYQAA